MDLIVDEIETDIKFTIGKNWTIPLEAHNHPCILLSCSEEDATFNLGIVVIREQLLNPGMNRDRKSTLSSAGKRSIHWLFNAATYERNFWTTIDETTLAAISSPNGGTERIAQLFRLVQRRPISRWLVEGLGQQKDSLKRLRKNGGARDILARASIYVLWGRNDRALIQQLGLPYCSDDEFISIHPETESDRALLASFDQ